MIAFCTIETGSDRCAIRRHREPLKKLKGCHTYRYCIYRVSREECARLRENVP